MLKVVDALGRLNGGLFKLLADGHQVDRNEGVNGHLSHSFDRGVHADIAIGQQICSPLRYVTYQVTQLVGHTSGEGNE